MNELKRCLLPVLLGLTLLGTVAHAQSGQLTIDADNGELDEPNGYSVYSGNVHLQQQDIDLTGDRLTIERPNNGELSATMEGQPAKLTHTPPDADSPIVATARSMTYNATSRQLTLEGGARIERGEDTLSADKIEYNLADRRMRAAGGESERVRITIPAPDVPDTP